MNHKDRTVLVTGAAGAIGKGIASGFCRGGASVFLTDINREALDHAVQAIRSQGGRCWGQAADVIRSDQVARVVRAAAKALGGRIDILVNVAGVVAQGKVEEISEGEWDRVFAVNCKGTFLFVREVVPVMKANKFGRIINFSSKSGKTGSALMCHYSAAKAAIIGLTQALAHELADDGITVNCLCPGITENSGVWDRVLAGYVENLVLSPDEVVRRFTAKVPLKVRPH